MVLKQTSNYLDVYINIHYPLQRLLKMHFINAFCISHIFLFQVVAVQIDPTIFDSYYNGCCNATFWPLFHSMPDRATFKGQHWNSYTIANKEFADCTMRALKSLIASGDNIGSEPPLIWIHDYHLMLAANWIRQV